MPALRFLPERTDFFVPFRAAATTVAEAARLLTDLVTGHECPDQAVLRLRELEHRGDEITHEIYTALARNLIAPLSYEDIRALAASSTTSPTRSRPSASGWRCITCFPRPRWRNS